jgi:peptidoglycan hydrolase-like protein with peptidoglycan-binding domain
VLTGLLALSAVGMIRLRQRGGNIGATDEHAVMRRALAVTAALVCVAALPADAAAGKVWFLRDGDVAAVERGRADGVAGALRALLAGPTTRERAAGYRTALPRRLRVRSFTIRHRLVTLDLSARVAASGPDRMLRSRVRQLVLTVGGIRGVVGVRVLVEGGVPLGLFPGVDLRRPLRPAALPQEPERGLRALQQRLDDLGFLPQGGVSGVADERTSVAVLAFEKWARLPRDGRLDAHDASSLLIASRPRPARRLGPGRRIEVLLDRQLALLIENGRVERVVHISTGAPGWSTPVGSFRVYRKERYSWSVPFEVWMPWASYFTGGIAFHEYSYVPALPASHGCVRVNRFDALMFYGFARYGTPVEVRWR